LAALRLTQLQFTVEVTVFLGDITAIALSVVGFLLSLQGLWLLCLALWPRRVEGAAQNCQRHVGVCWLLGIPVTAVMAVVAVVLATHLGTAGQLSAWFMAGVFIIYAGAGMSGFVTHLGRRLGSPADVECPWRATIRGGVALELACLLPIIGWFGFLPASIILGAGSITLSFFGSAARGTLRTQSMELPAIPGRDLERVGVMS
jgi:hypothetical protein